MVAETNICGVENTREAYQWVWVVTKITPIGKEKPPMEAGDRLFISVATDGKTSFFHRTKRDPKNTALWNNACAILCEETGVIVGSFSDGRTFKMTIAQTPEGIKISCNHRRNPNEGDWDAEDGSTPT
ncbi:MAG: hypothetical protein AAF004_03335 [Pseudomonadota bacterium]